MDELEVKARFLHAVDCIKVQHIIPSDREFAKSIGMSMYAFDHFRSGDTNLSLEMVCRSVNKYGISIPFLFFGVGGVVETKEQKESREKLRKVSKDENAANEKRLLMQIRSIVDELISGKLSR